MAVVDLGRGQQAAVGGGGDGRLGRRLVDDRLMAPLHQVGGGSQVACLAAVVDGQVATGRADDHLGGVHPVAQRVAGVVAECGGGTHITKQPGQPVTAGWLRHGSPCEKLADGCLAGDGFSQLLVTLTRVTLRLPAHKHATQSLGRRFPPSRGK